MLVNKLYLIVAPALFLALAGCGGAEFKMAPVSGKVTLNGQALSDAFVSFEPLEGMSAPASTGKTDSEGKFSLICPVTNAKGAVVGKHRVRITAAKYIVEPGREDAGGGVVEEPVPAQYNTASELTFDVPRGGSTTADFALTKS